MTTNNQVVQEERCLRLILQSSSIPVDNIWQDGYYAAQDDIELTSNPYKYNQDEYKHWEDGWWAGFYGEPNIIEGVLASERIIEKAPVVKATKRKPGFSIKQITVALTLLLTTLFFVSYYAELISF